VRLEVDDWDDRNVWEGWELGTVKLMRERCKPLYHPSHLTFADAGAAAAGMPRVRPSTVTGVPVRRTGKSVRGTHSPSNAPYAPYPFTHPALSREGVHVRVCVCDEPAYVMRMHALDAYMLHLVRVMGGM
jgi:hypothetical protein